MPVEFLGMIGVKPSESNAAMHIIGGGIDHDYLCSFTMAHENSDFDGVLVGYTSASTDAKVQCQSWLLGKAMSAPMASTRSAAMLVVPSQRSIRPESRMI